MDFKIEVIQYRIISSRSIFSMYFLSRWEILEFRIDKDWKRKSIPGFDTDNMGKGQKIQRNVRKEKHSHSAEYI